MANEGLAWDSPLKMVHNPGGDWHPGWGVDLSFNNGWKHHYHFVVVILTSAWSQAAKRLGPSCRCRVESGRSVTFIEMQIWGGNGGNMSFWI